MALEPLGFRAAAFSEVDPFCCALLEQRFPTMPNLGDLTKWPDWDLPDADLLVGGTPCQSFSVAGKRASLNDDRGNLTMNYVDLFHAGRFACALWENVPGILNTDDNAFGCFLGGLVGAGDALPEPPDGRWPNAGMVAGPRVRAAWGIRGAEHFGLAQRRNRVFVVASARDGIDPAQILFERKSVQGHPSACGETRQDVAGTLSARTQGGGGLGTNFELDDGLVPTLAHALRGEGFDTSEDGTGRGTPLVPVAIQERAVAENPMTGPDGKGWRDDGLAYTLEARQNVQAVAFDPVQITSKENRSNPQPGAPCHTLPADDRAPLVAFSQSTDFAGYHDGLTTLRAKGGDVGGGGEAVVAFDARQSDVCVYGDKTGALDVDQGTIGGLQSFGVRRLLPIEAERLQGMPDGWTDIIYRGKPAADGPRYKSIGNSFAVPVVQWIGKRIKRAILAAHDADVAA